MLAVNAFSQVCRAFADRVGEGVEASDNSMRVLVGPPADAEKALSVEKDSHILNFFFYRVTPFEFSADGLPEDVLRLRLSCMITPFGQALDALEPSEYELRMLGGVLRTLHDQPTMALGDFEGETVQLQIVMQRTDAEELNHIWSTQESTTFRSSLIYEIALAPVVPSGTPDHAPIVGFTGAVSLGDADRSRVVPGAYSDIVEAPAVGLTIVDTADESWAPVICFVRDDACTQTVAVIAGAPEAVNFNGPVWIAGATGSQVTLRWRTWTRDGGWVDDPATVPATAVGPTMDPDQPPAAGALKGVSLPESIRNTPGQAALVAERTYSLESDRRPDGSDGPPRTVASNLLLVVVTS